MSGEVLLLKQTPVLSFNWNEVTGVTQALIDLFIASLEPDTFRTKLSRNMKIGH